MALVDLLTYASTPSSTTYDFTSDLQGILDAGDSAYIPVRRDANGAIIPYIVKGLQPPSDSVIICESNNSLIEAGASSWIMDVENGVHRIRISGGTWGGNSYGVFRHRRLTSGSLTSATFENMIIQAAGSVAVNRGFQIGSAAGCMWRDVVFQEIDSYGIIFQLDNGYANTNHIDHCKFFNVATGIYFTQSGAPGQKHGNSIAACWFESAALTNPLGAIRIKGFSYGMTIERCYFERTASGDFADIWIEDAKDDNQNAIPCLGIVIRDNSFANPNESQECRIVNVGRASYIATDNRASVSYSTRLSDHQTFARCEGLMAGGRDYQVWLHRNQLHYLGTTNDPASYNDAAFVIPSSVSNPQSVDVIPHPASAGFALGSNSN